MGFKDSKQKVIDCLINGLVSHELRNDIDIKNLLAVGQVSLEEVAEILRRSRGNNYSTSPHHYDSGVDVHIVRTRYSGEDWYIKWYFIEPNSIFISVHH